MDNVLIDLRVKRFWCETKTKDRLGLRCQNGLDYLVQRVPMKPAMLGIKFEKFLHENADGLRMKLGDLLDVRIEHRFL